MDRFLNRVARLFWRDLDKLTGNTRVMGVGDVVCSLYAFLLSLGGIYWLVTVTDPGLFIQYAAALAGLAVLIYFLNRQDYFFVIEITPGRYGDASSSFEEVLIWSAVLILGPTALWVSIVLMFIDFVVNWAKVNTDVDHWKLVRNFLLNLSGLTLSYLIAVKLYILWGGILPFPGFSLNAIGLALAATLVKCLIKILIWMGYILYFRYARMTDNTMPMMQKFYQFIFYALGVQQLSDPFAILAAGLYAETGYTGYLFFTVALLATAFLANRLSQAAERSRQQSRQLEMLEALGRAIINAQPDASTLPEILSEYALPMFPYSKVEVCCQPDKTLFRHPIDVSPVPKAAWKWLGNQKAASIFPVNVRLPWNEGEYTDTPVLIAPIIDGESGQMIGGIYIALQKNSLFWKANDLVNALPVVRSLAAQIASAFHRADLYKKELENQKLAQELALAGQIQSSFLPERAPEIAGWQFSVAFNPARETSGDFYDFIPLPDGKWGILIADVSDKGVGPAIYMALCRTLIRTFAFEFAGKPEMIMNAVNRRIQSDTRADLFVTVLFGILDPASGVFEYANAGHNPPIHFHTLPDSVSVRRLEKTGMAVGVLPEVAWERQNTCLDAGDVLLLYTDGLSDLLNGEGEFIDETWFIKAAKRNLKSSAQGMQTVLLDEVRRFVGEAPQFDDVTFVIIKRDAPSD
jgi:serine phosphatase RsbU (regulator of sigma subunit)